MPGPGGGSRGGGGGFSGGGRGGSFGGGGFGGGNRGGGFGGGPRPGGFGGPHHRPPHHHHHHHGPHFGWGWHGPHYHGVGCSGAIFAPIVISIFVLFMIAYIMMPAENTENFGKEYNEAAFQAAADAKYNEFFAHDSTYEDNILLYFLVEEECEQIYFIAWVGDNIQYDINYLFGGNNSDLGKSVYNNVPQYYAFSLDSNLAAIMNDMESEITKMQLESSFKKATKPASPSESKLVDLTGTDKPDLTAETVNDALASFTEATGIRTVVCVDYIDNVFAKSGSNGGATAIMVICIGVLVAVIALTSYSNNKNRKKREDK